METPVNIDSSVTVKMEPLDEEEKTHSEKIWIKEESADAIEIEVKCDPFEYDVEKQAKTDEDEPPEGARPIRKTRQKKKVDYTDPDDDQKKKATKPKVRRPVRNFEDVNDAIEIITLTDEQRQKEHDSTLAFLTPLDFVCKDCAMGYNTKESYDEHMKEHSVHLGSYLCELCNTHYQTSEALEEHKQSHYLRYSCSFCHTQFKQKETAGCHIIQLHRPDAMFGCCYCTKGFRRVSALKGHEKACPRKKKYTCNICTIDFKNKIERALHNRRMHKKNGKWKKEPLICKVCGRNYQCRASLTRHLLSHDLNVTCEECNIVFPNRLVLRHHNYEAHNPQKAHLYGEKACPHCPRVCVSSAMLKRHIARMHDGRTRKRVSALKGHEKACPRKKKYTCNICTIDFKNKIERALHNRRMHKKNGKWKKEPLICKVCGRNYQCRASLTRHLLSHDLNVTCEECNIVFPNRLVLRHHNYEAHNPQKAHLYGEKACPHCPRVCVSSAMLKRHIARMHDGRTRKYQCDYCNRTYLTKSDVRTHISWSHLRDSCKQHVCHCGHVFRSPTLLKKHEERVHAAGKRDFLCGFCGERFKYKKFLKRHLMTHPEKKLACEKCGIKFQTRAEVKAHKLEHLEESKEGKKERVTNKEEFVFEPNVELNIVPKVEHLEDGVSPSRVAWRGHKPIRGRPPPVNQY